MESVRPVDRFHRRLEERSLAPLRGTGMGYFALFGLLLILVAVGVFAYSLQLRDGLVLTGMRDRVSWGLYIAMYIFLIGARVGATIVTATLRMAKLEWASSVTRSAEIVTMAALPMAALFILFNSRQNPHLTAYKMIFFGRWESPITWDIYAMATYLVGSLMFMYATLIPDLAYCRDQLGSQTSALKRWVYTTFALDWHDTPAQRRYLSLATNTLLLMIIPLAVMMATITSWLFTMTLREPWNTAMFSVFFLAGSLFSGVGMVIVLMAVLRKVYDLEEFIIRQHFIYLGYALAAFALIVLFLNMNQFITHAYKLQGSIAVYLQEVLQGSLAPLYWVYLGGGLVLPLVIIALPMTRTIGGIVVAAVLVIMGTAIERYLMVVGGLQAPVNPYELPVYSPTWVEWSVTAAGIAGFMLIIMLLLKLVPGVAVTDLIEDVERLEQVETVRHHLLSASDLGPSTQPLEGGD